MQPAFGDVPPARELPLGLGHCTKVTSSRCDLVHRDASAG